MAFDPKNHRFGIAYVLEDKSFNKGKIFYPTDSKAFYYDRLVMCLNLDTFSHTGQDIKYLTRAPEHDLIPISDVLALYNELLAVHMQFGDRQNGIAHSAALTDFVAKYNIKENE